MANGPLSHRIRLPGRRDEFRELADSFDTMLAQLEAHVAEQQRFAANASHELRTPLAVTQTLLDATRNDPNRDTCELVERLRVVNTRAIDLTEALLLLNRANQRSFTREDVDLSLLAEEATETLLPLAEKHGVTIETSGDMSTTIGSQALLLQMVMNLLHNAIGHNLPEQGTVWVHTSVRPDTVVLTVENTGEKLTSQLVSTLTEPFQRGTERIHSSHAGVGLGLAIVKTITQAHDGTLTLTPRPAAWAPRHGATARRVSAHTNRWRSGLKNVRISQGKPAACSRPNYAGRCFHAHFASRPPSSATDRPPQPRWDMETSNALQSRRFSGRSHSPRYSKASPPVPTLNWIRPRCRKLSSTAPVMPRRSWTVHPAARASVIIFRCTAFDPHTSRSAVAEAP